MYISFLGPKTHTQELDNGNITYY